MPYKQRYLHDKNCILVFLYIFLCIDIFPSLKSVFLAVLKVITLDFLLLLNSREDILVSKIFDVSYLVLSCA